MKRDSSGRTNRGLPNAMRRSIGISFVLLMLTMKASGSVAPTMSFDALLAGADTVFRGEVVAVQPQWIEYRGSRGISTLVVFKVDRLLKGDVSPQIALDFLGGTIGETSFEVAGAPRFQLGDRAVLFVRRQGRFISPIVGFWQGRFPIQRDVVNNVDVVTTNDGWAFASVSDIGAVRRIGPPVRTIRLEDFERAIEQGISRAPR